MHADRSIENHDLACLEFVLHQRWERRQSQSVREHGRDPRYSYRMKLGRETIRLDPIAFRILSFLAARPYRAYTRRRLARAVSTPRHPVAEEALDRHVARLRNALGFFRDYIQTVPSIGYRFKA